MIAIVANFLSQSTPDSPTNWPAVWSAIAATFSAISAVLVYRIHRRNLVDSVRPELVLSGWELKEEMPNGGPVSVRAGKIKNIGRGPALNIEAEFHTQDSAEGPLSSAWAWYRALDVIASNHEEELGLGVLLPSRTPPPEADPFVDDTTITVLVRYDDLHSRRYELTYVLAVRWGPPPMVAMGRINEIVWGLKFIVRRVRRIGTWHWFESKAWWTLTDIKRRLNQCNDPDSRPSRK